MFKLATPLVLTILVAGCVSKPKPAEFPPPPTADQVSEIKDAFLKVSPGAKIGVVSTILSDMPYAMISDIDTAGIEPGDLVSFIDSEQSTVAYGKVVKVVDASKVAVSYTAGKRAPLVGDVAVKF